MQYKGLFMMCSMKEWNVTKLASNDIYCYFSLTAPVPCLGSSGLLFQTSFQELNQQQSKMSKTVQIISWNQHKYDFTIDQAWRQLGEEFLSMKTFQLQSYRPFQNVWSWIDEAAEMERRTLFQWHNYLSFGIFCLNNSQLDNQWPLLRDKKS